VKCLVTGAAGFIGSNIVDRLLKDGHEVVAIDNESAECHNKFYWNPKAENHVYDVCDYSNIATLFKGVDYVLHLAAEARIQPSLVNPFLTTKTNVLGTLTVLQAARSFGVKRVVYSSTSSAYGRKHKVPYNEDMVPDCLTPYSVSKVTGEEYCKLYTRLFGLSTVTLRYFNVYGKNQPLKGQYAPVVGLFMRQHGSGQPMTIVGDGLQRRDFTHVDDVVEANILAAISTNEAVDGELFNIGTGVNYDMMDLATMIGKPMTNITFLPERKGESRETLADISKAKRILNWEPKVVLPEWINKQYGRL
jgi:UDP-glucose 4-epimerase